MPALADIHARTRLLAVTDIRVDRPHDPKGRTEREAHGALTTSIAAGGLNDPIRVEFANGRYRLTDGRKRLAACADAGLTVVPALVVANG